MKSETQIAQKNIRIYISSKKTPLLFEWIFSHKATCQRFLEFLEELWKRGEDFLDEPEYSDVKNKITDLKQAIKSYEDAGI